VDVEDLNLQIAQGDRLSAPELHDLLRLRVDVFVVEQRCPYPELDGKDIDPRTHHLWYADDEGVMASLRLLSAPSDDPEVHQIGRVVTRSDVRGCGLATELMTKAHHHVDDQPTLLSAQSYLQPWYETLGYRVVGEEFEEDGIAHLPMKRDSK